MDPLPSKRAEKAFSVTRNRKGYTVKARVIPLGAHLLVVLSGGVAHIGAIGIGEPRPSLTGSGELSATGSVFTFLGHKEDTVAKGLAEDLARTLNRRVVVVAGLHWDHLDKAGIEVILRLCKSITRGIIKGVDRA